MAPLFLAPFIGRLCPYADENVCIDSREWCICTRELASKLNVVVHEVIVGTDAVFYFHDVLIDKCAFERNN